MPEIGATLREARMRARVEISEIELETKIRAKYLRALENEEWALLPGPTFVRSFLRTYAEYLGLDAKMLVEEFRSNHEQPSALDLAPIGPPAGAAGRSARGGRSRNGRRSPISPSRVSRGGVIAIAFFGLIGILILLSFLGDDPATGPGASVAEETAPRTQAAARPKPKPKPKPRSRTTATPSVPAGQVRLELKPTGQVYVCLEDDGGKRLIPGEVLTEDGGAKTFTAKSFRMRFGSGNVQVKVNGKVAEVPQKAEPVAFEVTSKGAKEIAGSEGPGCA